MLAPGTFPAPQKQRQGFFKVDHRFSDHNALDVRYSFNRNTQEGQSVGGLNTYDRRTNTDGRTDALRRLARQQLRLEQGERGAVPLHLRHRRLLLAADGVERRGVANARLLVPSRSRSSTPASATSGPTRRIRRTWSRSGRSGSISSRSSAARTSSRAASTSSGRGASSRSSTTSPAPTRSRRGRNIPFNASDPATFPIQFTQTFGISGLNFKDAMIGVFAQDDWEVRRGLTLNLGVRWDKDSLFQGDNNNFAPRVGFAWNADGDAKTVIRGKHGHLLRHARVVDDQPRVEHRPGRSDDDRPASGRSALPDVPEPSVGVSDRRGDGAACPGVRADLPGRRLSRSASATSSIASRRISSTRTSACSTSSAPNWALSADYTRVYGYDLLVTFDINAPPYFALGPGQTRTQAQADRLRPLGVAEHDRAGRTASTSPDSARCICSTTAAARSTTPSSSR